MPPTVRLFDRDSRLSSFSSEVLSCARGKGPREFLVVLRETAFFPAGGGQESDEGRLGGLPVAAVRNEGGEIVHTVLAEGADPPFAEGQAVRGEVDFALRFARMQNHTGEHIVSGLAYRKYGYRNVGFHLGRGEVTLDFDGFLDRAALNEIEDEANRVVCACAPVRAFYPSPEELAALPYRSKRDLPWPVRIVEIGADGAYDRCACCAPHVANTGEIGIVKLLDAARYKGGVRIHMLCGSWAAADYRRRYEAVASIAAALSVRQEDVAAGFSRLLGEAEQARRTIAVLRGQAQELTAEALPPTDGNLCLFVGEAEPAEARRLLNRVAAKCGCLCGVFAGDDERGYRFYIGRGSSAPDLLAYRGAIQTALSARGGGSSEMLQGHASAPRAVIEAFFQTFRAERGGDAHV